MIRLTFVPILLVLVSISVSSCLANIILKPTVQSSATQTGYIFMQGAFIPATSYTLYAKQLQQKFNGSLWIALAEYPMNLPDPLVTRQLILSVLDDFKTAGFNFSSKTPFFFGGHSLGGAVIQSFMLDIGNIRRLPVNVTGLILEGAFVTRSNQVKTESPIIPPVFTVGAELDGLARATRMAESFYHDQTKNRSRTVIIPSMNHFQFAGEGQIPSAVAKNDIKAEISNEQARDALTSLVIAFMHDELKVASTLDINILNVSLDWTRQFVYPIIEALKLEGFYHFNEPCYKTKEQVNCTLGSSWSPIAQIIMANTSSSKLDIADLFHPVASIPDRFPSINNKCVSTASCVLNVSTTTENEYSFLDSFDNGLYPIAATEARTKLKSRQAILEALTNQAYDFNQTDGSSLCAFINKKAIDTAFSYANAKSLQRYNALGKLLNPIDDHITSAGPTWIITQLKFSQRFDQTLNRTVVDLTSASLKTKSDFTVKAIAGVHYCKLLTVARALEWIYIDSLKP